MRTLLTFCSLIAAGYFAIQHNGIAENKTAAETRLLELTQQVEATKTDLRNAMTQIVQLSASAQPAPRSMWVDEKNRNWQTSLKR